MPVLDTVSTVFLGLDGIPVFLCQVINLYTVIVVSIYNLTVGSANSNLWTALLISCLSYLLSNPTINQKHAFSDLTQ
jgi:hypothetical protein